ncbi:MAG: NUDIX hydrolase [Bacteroidetes bacterium]|nr:NUDIX hydrolase [Bacteroidota bacterium]MBP7398798.1 NUDIX hydrolase [Chitinophagales bacterium]MBP8753367.1 NUDIX hydrolase [Chitinophagales bacterium]MBP9189550.1 NUDIX hydrolase [Chitinophagales bacterium]MBP9550061.1 NUDIX hydrolase [Chitinophagales bacterium]
MENPWKTKSVEKVYENPWIEVSEHQVKNPSGGDGIYGVVHFKNYAIGILPVDSEKNIWLIGQYRYPLKTYTWEIPEGGGPLHIDPLESAKRELLEEAGLIAAKWKLIQTMQVSNSCTDEFAYIYLCEELTSATPNPDEDEVLEIRKLPFDEAYAMLEAGEILDSLTVVALLKAKILFG